ncbi:hypothetical protein QBC47DRAFT_374578 [Echria macrotheca]|uniref:Tim44-like domain-containing protein n=1 Tax=Echria macrotheca TaxID=438768 RepID=A0AAJ0BK96_9PEZI|nr:hypothetical protein QBC47DRAFT_374578 [Echria macrotheca]
MASSRIGLRGVRGALSMGTPTATIRRTGWATKQMAGWSPCSGGSSPSVRRYGSAPPKFKTVDWTPPSPKTQMMENQAKMSLDQISIMLPGTLIAPPLSQYPKNPIAFIKFVGQVLYVWLRTTASGVGISWSSKPSFFKGARYKLNNAAALLEAKALHRAMAEALASGDKSTINRVCTKLMATPMLAAIDARPRTRRFTWELLEYARWRNPRIASQMLAPVEQGPRAPLLRQMVVRIASKQRRTEEVRVKDGTWRVVPGGEKVVDVVENLVLVSLINPRTWTQGEWRILGTIPSMTPKDWAAEKEMVAMLEREQLGRRG